MASSKGPPQPKRAHASDAALAALFVAIFDGELVGAAP